MTSEEKIKRKAPELDVPRPGQDPAERKRVLNVLAQRRYRQKKKEHLRKLEKQAQDNSDETTRSPVSAQIAEDSSNVEMQPSLIDLESFDKIQPDFPTESDLDHMFPPSDELPSSESDPMFFTCNPNDIWDTSTLFPLPMMSNSPSNDSSTTDSNSPTSPATSLSSSSQRGPDITSTIGFSDPIHLPVLELNLLKAAMSIAKRINVEISIWELEACSPFYENRNLLISYEHLPHNLRPTAIQRSTPHHPAIDILPWPSVRNKLITVLSQPEDLRPPVAASPTALVEFVYDFEDSAEGVRIWGDDPYSGENWEVGQQLFKRWWWAFDGKVIETSNLLRQQRGAARLSMETCQDRNRGRVLGELT